MSELEALLLGIVQGLTEFLPISSSGHLILVPWLQDYTYLETHSEFNKTFDVALHAGTLVAVVSYFRADLWRMVEGFLRSLRTRTIREHRPDARLGRRRGDDPGGPRRRPSGRTGSTTTSASRG